MPLHPGQPVPGVPGPAVLLQPRQAIRGDCVPFCRDERRYFELDTLCAECARPVGERRLPIMRHGDGDAIAVYRRWRELNA